MKILFAALMCLVLGGAQCFAISGGPVYPGALNVVGTFGGVLLPRDPVPGETASNCGDLPDSSGADCASKKISLGIFSIGVPQTGLGSGGFVMFSEGRVFAETITGTADPGKATLKGVLTATFDYTISFFGGETLDVTASANGSLETNITDTPRSFSTASTRLQGTALLNISQGPIEPTGKPISCCLDLDVVGFKQSTSVNTT